MIMVVPMAMNSHEHGDALTTLRLQCVAPKTLIAMKLTMLLTAKLLTGRQNRLGNCTPDKRIYLRHDTNTACVNDTYMGTPHT